MWSCYFCFDGIGFFSRAMISGCLEKKWVDSKPMSSSALSFHCIDYVVERTSLENSGRVQYLDRL